MIDLGEIRSKQELADLCEMTAEELDKRAQKLLTRRNELLGAASELRVAADVPNYEEDTEARSVSRFGEVVTERVAIDKAIELRSFTRQEFADSLGLKRPAASRWIAKLINKKHPIIERRADGSYVYLEPPELPGRGKRHQPPPEELLVDAGARESKGMPVGRKASERARRSDLSKPGRAHQIRQQDKRFDKVRSARAAEKNGKM